MIFIGIDPGVNGSIVRINDGGIGADQTLPRIMIHQWNTTADASHWLKEKIWQPPVDTYAVIEKVTRPTKLTRNAGEWVGLLTALGIPFKEVPPKKWQKHFGTFAKEHTRRKNQLKQIAQQLHPEIKWTHKTADAYLIAVYCREVAW